ncbi:hypothetical protein AQAU111925_13465 [Aquirufa aurantiipilula]
MKVVALTATAKRSAPAAEIAPSVTATEADSALNKTIEAVATPSVNVRLVVLPKFIPPTVGTVLGLNELLAPEKVSDLDPVYPVATLPLPSLAVMVIVCAPPAVCVAEPVITNLVAAPGKMVTLPLVAAVPEAGVKVKVPVPTSPV